MFIVTILPIARGINKSSLTYFSKEEIKIGSLVTVPLRTKNISGIVLDSIKAESMRSELKNLSYPLKKIQVDSKSSFFNDDFLKTVKETARHFASTEGALLSSIVPKVFFELSTLLNKKLETPQKDPKEKKVFLADEKAMQTSEEERFDIYKGIIREAFAKKESVFICAPTEGFAKKILERLNKGIEEYSLQFSASLTKKKIKENIEKIITSTHPLFVVGNHSYLPIIREDTKTIIIEEESSQHWRQNVRPFIDIRFFLRTFAKHFKAKVIYADTLLSVETLYKIKQNEITEYSRIMARGHKSIPTLLVDMRKKYIDDVEDKIVFEVLSPDLKEMISYADKNNKSLFLLGTRRGLAPQTICRDCGRVVLCHKCEAPVVLHKGKNTNDFICHHCGSKRSADETCKHCGSWRLESFGIGIERIIDEIKPFTSKEIFRLDADVASKPETLKKIMEDFIEKKGVLVGTELALNYLPENSVDYTSIVSFDSLFSLPDFRMEEKIMHLILKAKAVSKENFLVQGRNIGSPIVEYAISEDFSNFLKYEIDSRKTFGYPPFKILIKITITGKKEVVARELHTTAELLKPWSAVIFPAFIKTIKGQTLSHILLKLEPKDWPDKKLREVLLSFSPSYQIRVDPESLL